MVKSGDVVRYYNDEAICYNALVYTVHSQDCVDLMIIIGNDQEGVIVPKTSICRKPDDLNSFNNSWVERAGGRCQ